MGSIRQISGNSRKEIDSIGHIKEIVIFLVLLSVCFLLVTYIVGT